MGDILPLPIMHSDKWRSGWNEKEKELFPHISRGYKWNRPEWAKKPEYEGNEWRTIPHKEVDEWGCIWKIFSVSSNILTIFFFIHFYSYFSFFQAPYP